MFRLLWRGTRTGPYSGIPATCKQVEVRVINLALREGQGGNWTVQNHSWLLQQAGVIGPDIQAREFRAPAEPDPTQDPLAITTHNRKAMDR